LTEAVIDVLLLWLNRRALLRLALPLSPSFTAVILLVTILSIPMFNWTRVTTYIWYGAYGVSVITLAATLLYEPIPLAPALPTSPLRRLLLVSQGVLLLAYGGALLLAPQPASAFWPWQIGSFDARLYSALFFSGGVGAVLLARRASTDEILLLGVTELCLGVLVPLGLLTVDLNQPRIAWLSPGTLLWPGIFALLSVSGDLLIWRARPGLQSRLPHGSAMSAAR